jgi:hypothetical protein
LQCSITGAAKSLAIEVDLSLAGERVTRVPEYGAAADFSPRQFSFSDNKLSAI